MIILGVSEATKITFTIILHLSSLYFLKISANHKLFCSIGLIYFFRFTVFLALRKAVAKKGSMNELVCKWGVKSGLFFRFFIAILFTSPRRTSV